MLSKIEIKQWLRNTGKNREWLATQLQVSKRTVDNWLRSAGKIPYAKCKLIENLMAEPSSQKLPAYDEVVFFPVRMSQDEWRQLCDATGLKDPAAAEIRAREFLQMATEKLLREIEEREGKTDGSHADESGSKK